jgi:hypothetical protein
MAAVEAAAAAAVAVGIGICWGVGFGRRVRGCAGRDGALLAALEPVNGEGWSRVELRGWREIGERL